MNADRYETLLSSFTYIGGRLAHLPTREYLWQHCKITENPMKAGQAICRPEFILTHSRWVFTSQVFIAREHPVVTGLHAMSDEAKHHRLCCKALLLGEPYHLQEQGDLVPLFVGRGTVPVGVMMGQMAGVRK